MRRKGVEISVDGTAKWAGSTRYEGIVAGCAQTGHLSAALSGCTLFRGSYLSGFEPCLERDNDKCPTEGETSDGNCKVQEHHHVVVSSAHGSKIELFHAKLKHEPTTGEEETRERLSGRTAWQYA